MPKFLSTRISVVSRGGGSKGGGGGSAVDASGYMDREERESEYDGHKYHPDAKEDLVHKEVDLPDNAPREYQDPNVLWNAVEMVEKNKNAQLCRMMKASLPNNWSYEVAKETVRQYVMDNFVSKGMCCEWAIHDSVNKHGQRNLHFHCLMTLRAMDENGKWLPKQRKIYILDENGNKIRRGKNYLCKTEQVTDWNDKGKAKEWRKNLSDLINKTNDALKINETWEHRSFKELGIDALPTIHLGSEANALENKGIHTERGDYNRKVMEMRGLAKFIDYTSVMIENYKKAAVTKVAEVKNEIVELIDRVVKRHNFLKLPLVSGVFLAKVSNRQMLQDPNNMISFLEKNDIKSFDELHSFSSGHLAEYNKLAAEFSGYCSQIKALMAKIEAYDRFKPFLDVFRKSESLKGLAKWKYDKENRVMLEAYPEQLKAFRKVVPKGEKIDPKKWNDEMAALFNKREDMEGLLQKEVGDLACVEVIDFNKKNEEREHSNDIHAKEKAKERPHDRGKKHDFSR